MTRQVFFTADRLSTSHLDDIRRAHALPALLRRHGCEVPMRWVFLGVEDFAAHWSQWDRLNESNGGAPLLRSMLMRLALRYFGNGTERLAVASRGGEIVAMLILGGPRYGAMHMFQPSQLPLGPFVSEPHTSLAELSDSLGRSLPFACVLASLTQIDPEFLHAETDVERLRTLEHIETGFIDLPDSMQSYLASRPKKKMHCIDKRLRKAAQEMGAPRLDLYRYEKDVASFLDRFADIESAGWKGGEGTALARGNEQHSFYVDLMRSFCRSGEARMYELVFGEQTAAMQLAVESGGKLYLLKSTYDERLSEYGPGVSIKQFIFDRLISYSACRRVEFYGRVIEPHRIWLTGSRRLFHANVYRNALYARLHDAMRERAQ